MFARYFVELPLRADDVERALLSSPQAWVPNLASRANDHGDTLLAEVGFGDGVRLARKVEIEFGKTMRLASKTLIPLRWTATGSSGLFPALDADIEVAPLGPETTQIAMSARYVPPLGLLGRVVDRTILFRVAEATLKDFLDGVAEAIRNQVGTAGRLASGGA
jgi:hypothetical protein